VIVMTTDLPIAVEFRLPDGWEPAPVGDDAPDTMFIALSVSTADSGFTANITVDGEFRPDVASLEQVADESVVKLLANSPDTTITRREEIGSFEMPGMVQDLRFSAEVNGNTWDVVQSQVYFSAVDTHDARKRTVLCAALTSTDEQFPLLVEDFGEFLSTLRFAAQ
jgi:hypothetical protein